MAKISISRIFEVSKSLQTNSGKELTDFISYMADFAEQTLRALRNGLTLRDNLNSIIQQVSLTHETAQVINTNGRQPVMIWHRTLSTTTAISVLVWSMNSANQLTVVPTFKGAPTGQIPVELTLIFQ